MGRIINLGASTHQQVQALLPWYVNGTLDPGEQALADAHLADCEACRADLAAERVLHAELGAIPEQVERDWAVMRTRLEEQRATAPRRPLWSRPVPLGGAIIAQAAAIVLMIGAASVTLPMMTSRPAPAYHALSAPKATPQPSLIVMFRPETTEAELSAALLGAGVRVIDGPTANHAYVLSASKDARGSALAQLRADRHVALAESLDGAGSQP